MEYNTERDQIVISEYGRSVQHMINFVMSIEDPEKRQKNAEAVVETMAILNAQMKGVEDYKQRFWDHMIEISDWQLDVESPYGMPDRTEKESKPEPIAYPHHKIRWNHLGKNVEELFKKAMAENDPDKKRGYAQALGLYMKVAYKNYHEETVTDEEIKKEITNMSNGALQYEANEYRKYVDGTLSESQVVTNVRSHKLNKNYSADITQRSGQRNTMNRFGNNNNKNRFGNKNYKNKR
jgi:hypothetical protein